MGKYISGQELIEICHLADFELFELAAIITPLTKTGNRIVKPHLNNAPTTWERIAIGAGSIAEREEHLEYLKESFFKIDELPNEIQHLVYQRRKPSNRDDGRSLDNARKRFLEIIRAWAEKMRLNKGEAANENSEQAIMPFPCDRDTTWKQISFILKTDELVLVRTPKGEARLRYDKLDFADKRSGDKPKKTWGIFQLLAKGNGEIALKGHDYVRKLPDFAWALDKSFRALFGITESIWKNHYKKSKSYRSSFTISDDRNS